MDVPPLRVIDNSIAPYAAKNHPVDDRLTCCTIAMYGSITRMKTAFLFPGQGAQAIGMGKDLYDGYTTVRELFALASDVAGRDMAALVFTGSDEDLKQTDNTQIAVTLVNLSASRVLAEHGVRASAVAGFSLGEYAALVDAKVLSAEDAFRLVVARGDIMERVSRQWDDDGTPSGMAAVMGLDLPQVCAALEGIDNVYPSLYNSPAQTVVGGTAAALEAVDGPLKAAGAKRIVRLAVSGPFHTPLMAAARDEFAAHIDAVSFQEPQTPLYSNVNGALIADAATARGLCLDQLVSTVRWTDEERALYDQLRPDAVLEVGPGTVLCGLWRAMAKSRSDWPADLAAAAGTIDHIRAESARLVGSAR